MSTPNIIRWDQAYNRNGDGKLPRAAMNVIRTYMDNDTLAGWIKQENIADATGLDVRSVKRQIAANIAAGWLEITDRGNSSGKANDYRLTFPTPKGDTHVPIETEEQRGTHTSPLEAMVTPMSPEGGHGCPLKGDTDVTPTSPPTTPGTSPKRSSTDTDPSEGDRVAYGDSIRRTTSQSNGDTDIPLGPSVPGPDWTLRNGTNRTTGKSWSAWMPPRGSNESPIRL